MTTRKKLKISTEPNKRSNFVQLLKKRRSNHSSKKNRHSSKKRHTSKKKHSSNVIKKERMRRIPRRRSLTGVTHVETIRKGSKKKEVATKGKQDSNGESKEKKKSKRIEDNKKKIKSKGNMGDTRDTTINVEKKCKKNVKHDPVINIKQKCKEKEAEKKKITSRCKGNVKSNIPAINKERSSRPNNNQVTDQSKAEEIQIEKETNSETLCLPSKRRVRLKTEISNGKLIKTIQTRIGEDIRKLQNIESWLKDEKFSNFILIKNVDNQPLFLNENYFVQFTQCNSVITAIKYNMERQFTSSKHCNALKILQTHTLGSLSDIVKILLKSGISYNMA
ncbi:hypothetical protein M0812_04303 [Anaeramoeba flamelloides]|uniref:Uncharacterized protein n=1 Tax=Anaeramoeba flamelloides TaxID=1746091 RepID=A0AAV8AF51_9EUKA|nr:hypothetical protein M0812_04303 [Anaeramoeba flamelloides]